MKHLKYLLTGLFLIMLPILTCLGVGYGLYTCRWLMPYLGIGILGSLVVLLFFAACYEVGESFYQEIK